MQRRGYIRYHGDLSSQSNFASESCVEQPWTFERSNEISLLMTLVIYAAGTTKAFRKTPNLCAMFNLNSPTQTLENHVPGRHHLPEQNLA